MKFLVVTIILNWGAVKFGAEPTTKDLYIKASQVSAIMGTEDSQKDKDGSSYSSCKFEVDGKTIYQAYNSCSEFLEEVNSGLSSK